MNYRGWWTSRDSLRTPERPAPSSWPGPRLLATPLSSGRGRPPAATPAERGGGRAALDTYRAGASVRTVCAALGIHRNSVLAQLERAGMPRRACKAKPTGARLLKAAELYATGLSLRTSGLSFT
jgi:hypothetical protein